MTTVVAPTFVPPTVHSAIANSPQCYRQQTTDSFLLLLY